MNSSKQKVNIRQLSHHFLLAYKQLDITKVNEIIQQTDQLIVPFDFDIFRLPTAKALTSSRGEKLVAINKLLYDQVSAGKLRFTTSDSRL